MTLVETKPLYLKIPHGLKRYDHKKIRCRCDICKAARREYDRSRYEQNKDAIKARVNARRKSHGDLVRQQARDHYRRNSEAIQAKTAYYYYANRERMLALQKEYGKTEKGRALKRLDYFRRINAPGRATIEQVQARIDYFGGCCAYCGGPFEHVDHVICVASGGSNWPANLRPSCEACNLKKGAKPWRQWLKKGVKPWRQRLNLAA